jgi:pimeloyl-ACP methyl ester carboxylesterase
MSPDKRAMMLKSMATAQADVDTIAAWGKASDPSVVANATADDLTLDLRPELSAIKTPITLVYPDYVPLGRPAGASDAIYRAAYASVPHMTFVPVSNSLHFVMFDQPAQFNAALDAFLASEPS